MSDVKEAIPDITTTTEIIYTWEDGREEVRYRRPKDSPGAFDLINDVIELQAKHGAACPYSWRNIA
jgi:hypothetical protein